MLIEAKAIFDSVTILCLCDSGTALNTIAKKAVPIKSSEIIWKIPKTNSGLSPVGLKRLASGSLRNLPTLANGL